MITITTQFYSQDCWSVSSSFSSLFGFQTLLSSTSFSAAAGSYIEWKSSDKAAVCHADKVSDRLVNTKERLKSHIFPSRVVWGQNGALNKVNIGCRSIRWTETQLQWMLITPPVCWIRKSNLFFKPFLQNNFMRCFVYSFVQIPQAAKTNQLMI